MLGASAVAFISVGRSWLRLGERIECKFLRLKTAALLGGELDFVGVAPVLHIGMAAPATTAAFCWTFRNTHCFAFVNPGRVTAVSIGFRSQCAGSIANSEFSKTSASGAGVEKTRIKRCRVDAFGAIFR